MISKSKMDYFFFYYVKECLRVESEVLCKSRSMKQYQFF